MGLPYGCNSNADDLFTKRHKTDKIYIQKCEQVVTTMIIPNMDVRMDLSAIRGDCTACTVYLECLQINEIPQVFTIIQEYMSINARISCLFTIKKNFSTLKEWIKELKKFPIAGLHIQKSNREPTSSMYMITGILKVPTPVVNTYTQWNTEYPKNHDNNDVTNINKLNKEFDLETF